MKYIDPAINEYIDEHAQKEDSALFELNRNTHLSCINPIMLSGNTQGQFLKIMSMMAQPKCILEIGSYTGYSGICLSQGIQKGGKLITIELNEELEDVINEYFIKSGQQDKLDLRIGNAMDIIPTINDRFDLVFIDADKENYCNYFNLIIDKVNPGGLIIADNVLWNGKVLDKQKDNDTIAIDEFNKLVTTDQRVDNVIVPLRDGLMIMRKK